MIIFITDRWKTPLSKTTAGSWTFCPTLFLNKSSIPNYFQCEHPRRLIQTKVLVLITNWITLLILLIDECLAELLNQQVLSTTHITPSKMGHILPYFYLSIESLKKKKKKWKPEVRFWNSLKRSFGLNYCNDIYCHH